MAECHSCSSSRSRSFPVIFSLILILLAGCGQPAARDGGDEQVTIPAQTRLAEVILATESSEPQSPSPVPLIMPTVETVVTPTLLPSSTPMPPPASPTSLPVIPTSTAVMPASTAVPSAQNLSVYPQPVDPMEVELILASLSLEEKIGQMIMAGMPGTELDNPTWQRIVNEGLGGVIFLEKNGASPQQVRALTGAIQQAALSEGAGVPLFIAWNHEGGRVARRGAGLTRFPSNMAVGATGQSELPFEIGQAVGEEMLSLGVNMNYAPVLDVNTVPANPVIGLRAYGDDVNLVSDLGERYIAGQQNEGVIGVAKHFPGHGGVNADSHVRLPLLQKTAEEMWQTELIPFQDAADAGVGAVMVAHIEIPAIEPDGWPSSLSPRIVQGILRDQMGYEGVIMTDDLGMGALGTYPPQTKAVQAVLAGNDVLLTVNAQAYELYRSALLEAVGSGQIPETRIDESVRRILHLKLAYDLASMPDGELLPGLESHRQLMVDAGAAAVKLSRDNQDWLPLNLPNNRLLLLTPDKFNTGSTTGDGVSLLGEYLRGRGIDVRELIYVYDSPDHIRQVTQTALSQVGEVDAVVVVTWDAILRYAHFGETAQETMAADLLTSGKPVITIAGHLPYDSQRLATFPAFLKMYGDTPGQVAGLVSFLIGWD